MSSGHDKAVVVMNSLKPWLSAQALHKIRPTSLPPSLRHELLAVANSCGRRVILWGGV